MFNIGLAIITAVVSAGLAVLYNKFVIKNYPENERKASYVKTVVLFLIVAMALYGILSANKGTNAAIKEYTAKMDQSIKTNHSDNDLVKNGYDLAELQNDVSKLDAAVNDLKAILPSHTELGIDKTIYDYITSLAMKELRKNVAVVKTSVSAANSFADENNRLTVSSILDRLQKNMSKIVNIITIIAVIIFAVIFLVYIFNSLKTAKIIKKA